jgi:CheY-like chemotaxis protein
MVNEATLTDSLAVAERVRTLMSLHGIGKRQQTTELCRILGLSFSQGHRKLRGSSPWTLAQIRKVAEAFGEPAAQLVGTQSSEADVAGANAHEARLLIGTLELRCIAWIGAQLDGRGSTEFVAYSHSGEWCVQHCDGLPEPGAYEVAKIEIHLQRKQACVATAIIDSDVTTAKTLAEYLEQSGFTVTAFENPADFRHAARAQTFDAIITDWYFGDETIAAAIESIRGSEADARAAHARTGPARLGRSSLPNTSIFLLTDALSTGKANESEVSEVIRRFDVSFYEKPARLAILVAELSKRLHRV